MKRSYLSLIPLLFTLHVQAAEDMSLPVITKEMRKENGKDVPYMFIDGIKVHETDATKQPLPPVVTPGEGAAMTAAPADAIVLFDGTEASLTSNWGDRAGKPTKWKIVNGVLESVRGAGYIHSKKNFGSCQLHVEWTSPTKVEGEGQGRGNSGVFLMNTYEVQVLDSYQNVTYADGQAGALYGRSKPLVNACRKPGEWQSYDIIFQRPLFDGAGKVTRRATITVIHNGIVIQDHVVLSGGTGWDGPHSASEYSAHADKLPIALQDHGNPVRFRNIWIRELQDKPVSK